MNGSSSPFCHSLTRRAHIVMACRLLQLADANPMLDEGSSSMNGQYQSASIYTAVHNARTLCHEIGSEIIYDDPAFKVAMEMAYWLDELLCDWATKDVPSQ
jgi:hypothetical protein